MPRKKVVPPEPKPRTIEELKAAHKGYMLRTCNKNMQGYGGFQWPTAGLVTAPDWHKRPVCNGGLFGLLWGAGPAELLKMNEDGRHYLVVGINEWVLVDDDKIKAPAGEVVYCGDLRGAADLLVALGADPASCVGSVSTAGDAGTATAGTRGTATAGDAGTATAGDMGVISILFYDQKRNRYRFAIGYIGEGGLEPGVPYKFDGDRFVPAKSEE